MYILSDIFEGNYGISQTFGANPSLYIGIYVYGVKLKGHDGIDFETPIGTKILAPFNGKVLRVGLQYDFKNYGNVVVMWDPVQKCAVWFCHLSEVNVTVGQNVTKGQVLGKTGNTGYVIGPHLHFGLVETDAQGNRLNQYDGYGGMINPLGPKVQWVLGTPPVDAWVQKVDTLKISVDRLKSEFDGALANTSTPKQQIYEGVMSKIKKINDTGSL